MTIEKRIERIEAILDARGLDWDHPRVEEAVEASLGGLPDIRTFAQPNLRWRILEPGEVVQEGDWVNAKSNLPSDPPNGWGWKPAISAGLTVLKCDGCVFARPVADEPPAKEAEHPAGPQPDPGEGYRLLSKNPPEELAEGDGFWFQAKWYWPAWAEFGMPQQENLWYRRKIEPPKPPEPEYREPVLPADAGKVCEFSIDGNAWTEGKLRGYAGHLWQSVCSEVVGAKHWVHARIKKDA